MLAACPQVHKWALFERDPLPRWSDGPIALLGDACHPMTPYMAQGAANALEDAAVLGALPCETRTTWPRPLALRGDAATSAPRACS